MQRPTAKSVVCPTVVGREPLLAALDDLIADAGSGHGRTVLLAGEAGIGKSRLVGEVVGRYQVVGRAESVPGARPRVLIGQSLEPDRALPFAPWLDLLRTFLSGQSAEAVARAFGPAASELVRLLPELAMLLPGLTPAAALDPEQERRRLGHALVGVAARMAEDGPLLVVIEDLHWSDEASLDVLLPLARRVVALPVLVLLTYRSDEVHAALGHCLATLDRARLATELALPRLTAPQVDAMLQAIFELDRPVRADFLQAVHALTDGNPFFIEEVLKALLVEGDIFYTAGGWDRKPLDQIRVPRTVQDAVHGRLAHLGPAAREVLTAAAVAGQRFDFALLQAVTGLEERALLDHLKELIAAQLLVEETAEWFAFRHALTRQAVRAGLLARERQLLHQLIAATLERIYAATLDRHLEDLAYHSFEAGAWATALGYAQQAGERAQALSAPRAAIEQFTRALEAARHLPTAPLVRLYRGRGRAYETLGDFERARVDLEAALEAARAAGERRTEWQAMVDLGALWAGRDYQRAGTLYHRALKLAQALDDPLAQASSLNRVGNWLMNTGRPVESLHTHQRALAVVQAQGDALGTAETLDLLGMAHCFYGDLVAGVEQLGRAADHWRALGDRRGLASSLTGRGVWGSPVNTETVFSSLRSLDDCARDVAEALDFARQLDWPAGQAFVHVTVGTALGAYGEFGRGRAHGREGLRIASEIDHQQWIAAARCTTGQLDVAMLAPDRALQHLEAGLSVARAVGSAWWLSYASTYLALAHLLVGNAARAEAVLVGALPSIQHPRDVAERRLAWAWGELMLARGAPEAALGFAEQLLSSVPGPPREQPIPALLKLKGEALLALGRLDEAERALEEARRGAFERGARPLLWQIHRARGRVYQRGKRAEDARREFAAVRAVVASLAATIDDEPQRLQFLAAALASLPRERPPSPLRAAKHAFGGLTAREREVAALIAQGGTNREIAAALSTSERTVTSHVSNILNKLGCTSRTQIAVWAADRGLTGPT